MFENGEPNIPNKISRIGFESLGSLFGGIRDCNFVNLGDVRSVERNQKKPEEDLEPAFLSITITKRERFVDCSVVHVMWQSGTYTTILS